MKKILTLLITFMCLSSVCACQKTKSEEIVLPTLEVTAGEAQVTAKEGTHSWMTKDRAVASDYPPPSAFKEYIPVLKTSDMAAVFTFDNSPDEVFVKCWSDNYIDEFDPPTETLFCDGSKLELKSGGYIYEVLAKWGKNDIPNGDVLYYFYAIVE